ncbi:MAG: hypothetical protein K6C94_02240 [Candidatus Gastranaerophilales bacterium]|nr:hypothetical protein [Candidatus Gastranaerophilales bacterium]
MLCHILKTGSFKDSNGKEHNFTTADLDKIVDNFNNNHNRVPVCVGHPKTNSPAYGWFNSVKRIGENLYCDFKNVQEEFKTAVKKGLFNNRSISLDGDLNIRHLAFLGGQAPAIKGLEEFCFEQARENYTEIEINNFEDIENNGKDKPVEIEEIQKQLAESKSENEKLKAELEAKKQAEITKDFEDFCSEAIKNGNILPKHKTSVMNILQACSDCGTFNFEDKQEDAVQSAKDFIKSIKMFDFEDVANDGRGVSNFADFDGDAWAKEIKKVMNEQNLSIEEAIQTIKRSK